MYTIKTRRNPLTLKYKNLEYRLYYYYYCRTGIIILHYIIRTEWHWAPRRNKYTCLSLLRVSSYYHNRFMHMNVYCVYRYIRARNTCSVHMRLATVVVTDEASQRRNYSGYLYTYIVNR